MVFVLHLVEALVFVTRRRRDRAGALVRAWTWNVGSIASLRIARRRSQSARVVPDREIHSLQSRGSARVAQFLTTSLHAGARVEAWSERGRSVADSASTKFRSLRGVANGHQVYMVPEEETCIFVRVFVDADTKND